MTRGEAIMKLSSLMMQCGMLMPIEWVRQNGEGSPVQEAVIMAQNALREREERSKGCEFCREDKDGFRQMVGSFSLSNPFHKGEYYLNCGKAKPIRIYDCPMCGRKLEVEG